MREYRRPHGMRKGGKSDAAVGPRLVDRSLVVVKCHLQRGSRCAAPAGVVIESRTPSLDRADGGGWMASLEFTNLTDAKLTLAATPAVSGDDGCTLTFDKNEIAAAEQATVKLAVPPGCMVGDDGFDFVVAVTSGASTLASFDVTAAPQPEEEVDWGPLSAFPVALGVLLLGAVVFYLLWDNFDSSGSHTFGEPLKHLEASWSFKESWVSNITVGAALLTGVFGSSEVVTALLGEDAERSIALATVGAAIAAAFIAAGPLLVAGTKKGGSVTVGGLLVASAVTLTGAAGELWVVYSAAQRLDLGGWEDKVFIAAAVGAVVLAVYAVRTLHAVLEQGTTVVESPPSDVIVAAEMIVATLKAKTDIDEEVVTSSLRSIAERRSFIEQEAGVPYVPPRRAAVL